MKPRFTKRGLLTSLTAIMFVVMGVLLSSAPVTVLGGTLIAGIAAAYLHYYITSAAIRRGRVGLRWTIQAPEGKGGSIVTGHPFSAIPTLKNYGQGTVYLDSLQFVTSTGLTQQSMGALTLGPVSQGKMQIELCAETHGYFVLHGATLTFRDIFNFFESTAYYPNATSIKVFPRTFAQNKKKTSWNSSQSKRAGFHSQEQRGMSGSFRELRDYEMGDPFKHISWKATARKQKLISREFHSETVHAQTILLDIGANMRARQAGTSKLGHSVELASMLANMTLNHGNQCGMTTFDTRVISDTKPSDGTKQRLHIAEQLLETHSIVDEDLTDISSSELVEVVSSYLRYQENYDCRAQSIPPFDSSQWQHLQPGPDGTLYDLKKLESGASRILSNMKTATNKSRPLGLGPIHTLSTSPALFQKLRLFCRMRSIELPYKSAQPQKRLLGFSQAIEHILRFHHPDHLLLLSDCSGLTDDAQLLRDLLARLKRARCALRVIYIEASPLPAGIADENLMALYRDYEESQKKRVTRTLAQFGIPVTSSRPGQPHSPQSSSSTQNRNQAA